MLTEFGNTPNIAFMNLVVDIGNTLLKYGVFEKGHHVFHAALPPENWKELPEKISSYSIDAVIVSSVAGWPEGLMDSLHALANTIVLDERLAVPVLNAYASPQTLGRDRLANACAAAALFPGEPVLIMDAGTCLKFDFVDEDNTYHGGAISPGLHMRFSALHTDTIQLPLLEPVAEPPLIGRDTRGSMQSGVVNGMIAEIDGIAEQYRKLYPRLRLVMTGGDAGFFLNQLKSRIFAAPNLTLIGLNAILDNLKK